MPSFAGPGAKTATCSIVSSGAGKTPHLPHSRYMSNTINLGKYTPPVGSCQVPLQASRCLVHPRSPSTDRPCNVLQIGLPRPRPRLVTFDPSQCSILRSWARYAATGSSQIRETPRD